MKMTKLFSIAAMLLVVVWSGCTRDDEPKVRPRVLSTSPVNAALGVATNNDVTATFSTEMDPGTITNSRFTLVQGTTTIEGTASYSGTTASFSPTANLAPNTLYEATITTGAKNLEGTGLAKNYVWSFTTGAIPDVILPTVTLINPLNNATGITLKHQIVITFSEPMNPATIISSTVTLKQGTTFVSGTIVYTGSTASFTPVSALLPNTLYTGTITTGAKDMAGNGLAVNRVFTFTTGPVLDAALPMVLSTDPLNNATGVARSKQVSINFSETMTASTINATTFTVKQGTTPVSGVVSYVGTTATFTPSVIFAAAVVYTASISTGAKDLAGNALATGTTWSFTTGAATSSLAPVDLGAAGNYVILAKSAVNNSPTSAVTGDIGLSPAATSFVTGFALVNATGYATAAQVTGKIFAADMAAPTGINLTTAVENMLTAYTDAAGRPNPDFTELGTGNIGGKTLTEGLYKWSSTVTIPASVTISGGANDVWIFQIAGDLTMSNAVNINLNGGAQAKNIFWQVAGTVTIGTTSKFKGVILSQTGITFQTGASLLGRALAQTAVVLDSNAITKP